MTAWTGSKRRVWSSRSSKHSTSELENDDRDGEVDNEDNESELDNDDSELKKNGSKKRRSTYRVHRNQPSLDANFPYFLVKESCRNLHGYWIFGSGRRTATAEVS